MSENKKIKNAQSVEYEGITFKSKLERMAYITLKEAGFPVEYEPRKFTLWDGFRPAVPFYEKDSATRMLKPNMKKIIGISYTPDFVFEYKGYLIVFEMKGMANDRYFLYRKMFRAWLERNRPKSMFFELNTKRQLMQAIDIIRNIKE